MSRSTLTLLVAMGFGIASLVLAGHGWIIPLSFFGPISIVVSALLGLLVLWDMWLWRLPPLHPWPVRRPDLTGTWRGEILREQGDPIRIYLVVDQTSSRIAYRTFTAESVAASMMANLTDERDGQFQLVGLYANTPDLRLQERSHPHRGAVWLRVHEETLEGPYWTDRDTKGELRFIRISRRVAGSFASAEVLAPREALRPSPM